MRDSQRQAVYNWERQMERTFKLDQTMPLDHCQDFIRYIWRKYANRYLNVPEAHDGRRRRRACWEVWGPQRAVIKLPRRLRTKWIIIHEIGHGILYGAKVADHGREFAKWVYEVYCRELKLPRQTVRSLAVHQKPRRVRFVTLAKLNEILRSNGQEEL